MSVAESLHGPARRGFRASVLRELGAGGGEIDELLTYNDNHFEPTAEWLASDFSLDDEPFVACWQEYRQQAEEQGAEAVLRKVFVQMQFPIDAGMADSADYRAATRRGVVPRDAGPRLELNAPQSIRIRLQSTLAGQVPVVLVGDRADFENLLRALTRRNQPTPIESAVGAMMISGYNNWDRIRRYRREWESRHDPAGWDVAFKRLIEDKSRYQDRFILASSGPYSGVAAAELGLEAARWRRLSVEIRIAHEAAHYFTRRALGSMRNNLLDELIADYAGLVAAIGRFRADWFLRFLGLQDYPRLDPAGRLKRYRGDPPLSDNAFGVLQSLIVKAARCLETVDRVREGGSPGAEVDSVVCALAGLTLEELASEQGEALLEGARRKHVRS